MDFPICFYRTLAQKKGYEDGWRDGWNDTFRIFMETLALHEPQKQCTQLDKIGYLNHHHHHHQQNPLPIANVNRQPLFENFMQVSTGMMTTTTTTMMVEAEARPEAGEGFSFQLRVEDDDDDDDDDRDHHHHHDIDGGEESHEYGEDYEDYQDDHDYHDFESAEDAYDVEFTLEMNPVWAVRFAETEKRRKMQRKKEWSEHAYAVNKVQSGSSSAAVMAQIDRATAAMTKYNPRNSNKDGTEDSELGQPILVTSDEKMTIIEDSIDLSPVFPIAEDIKAREMSMRFMYGDDAAEEIMELEAMLNTKYLRVKANYNPSIWPVLPLKM